MKAKSTTVKVEHDEYEGFSVDIAYISKEKTKRLLKAATTQKFSKQSHQLEADVNDSLFLEIYTKELIKGWNGLKMVYVAELMPIEYSGSQDEMLDYTESNALTLMKESSEFDQWITAVASDVGKFSTNKSKSKKTTSSAT